METRKRLKIGQTIIIRGCSANNPSEDIGKEATIIDINGEEIYYRPVSDPERDLFYAYEQDVEIKREEIPKDSIIYRKIAEGEKDQLIEMGFITPEGSMTQKGYDFIKTFG